MTWLEISIQVDHEETALAISELFDRHGQGGAVREQVFLDGARAYGRGDHPITVKTYLRLSGADDQKRHALEEGLFNLSEIYTLPAPHFRELKDEDWANAWKSHFKPQRIGRHLVFKLAEQDFSPTESDIVIDLEPGMAFGTGLHPTTRMCLANLEEYLKPGDRVLDMGTGSGILAIAAARLGAASVLALDNDGVAVEVARSNVSLNRLQSVVDVEEGSLAFLTGSSIRLMDGITINILADVIIEMMEKSLASHLRSGGWLIAGGIVEADEAMLSNTLSESGMQITARHQKEGWVTVSGVKVRPSIESQFRREAV